MSDIKRNVQTVKRVDEAKKITGSGRFSSKHFQRDEAVLVNIRGI